VGRPEGEPHMLGLGKKGALLVGALQGLEDGVTKLNCFGPTNHYHHAPGTDPNVLNGQVPIGIEDRKRFGYQI